MGRGYSTSCTRVNGGEESNLLGDPAIHTEARWLHQSSKHSV